jgi:hypothetical protein
MPDLELNFTNHSDNGTELVANTDNLDEWNRDYILQLRPQRTSANVTGVRSTGGARGHGLHGIGGRGGGAGVVGNAGGRSGVTGVIGIGSPAAGVGVHGFGSEDVDGAGNAMGIGVRGISSIGVVGMINDLPLAEEPCGIFGSALSTNGYTGIVGRSDVGIGIEGTSSTFTGVQGRSSGGIGVRGVGGSGSARGRQMLAAVVGTSPFGGIGVRGSGTIGLVGLARGAIPPDPLSDEFGVFGSSTKAVGVHGVSDQGVGVSGATTTGTAVLGVAFQPSRSGRSETLRTRGYAGHFVGRVLVDGDFAVTGAKSALVPVAKGKHKLLYCVESPEAWFEDFGDARLQHGSAKVSLSRDFADLISRSAYHVFLSPYGACNGLYITKKSRTGFVVREANGGMSSVRFSFRIVAKRKDLNAPRFREVRLPSIPKAPRPPRVAQPKPRRAPKAKKGAKALKRPASRPPG